MTTATAEVASLAASVHPATGTTDRVADLRNP